MNKRLIFILLITLKLSTLSGQDFQTYIKENAVKMEHLDSLEQPIYNKLTNFVLVMIGEMHGTNEPANFLIGLTELFANNGDTVQVGFEISSESMASYLQLLTDSSVFQSDFFSGNYADGRASMVWANAIARLTKNAKIRIFFFDIGQTAWNSGANRDSLMYLTIKEKIVEHPNWRTITLSGSIHNMRSLFRGKPTTAYYLCNDRELNLSDKICTLNHDYQSGTMMNNIGNELELRQVSKQPLFSPENLNYDNYFLLCPISEMYNGIIFTKTVTASEPILY